MEKGKDFENLDFWKSKRKRVWKLKNFSKIEKGKKERVFFCRNQKRKKGKDFFWKPGKERKNADSSYFQQNTKKNTHNHNFFIVFGRYMFQNVGCTLMKSFWDNKLWKIKVKFMNYIPFQRIVVGLWLLRCSQQLELPLLIRLVAISFYSND